MKLPEPNSSNSNSVNRNTQSRGRGRGRYRTTEHKQPGNNNRRPRSTNNKQRCYNCNKIGHFARDSVCPAKTKTCNGCGIQGHFAVCCHKGKQSGTEHKDKSAYRVTEEETAKQGNEDYYAFEIGKEQERAGEVVLNIGGVDVKGVLIDSGATCNIVDYNTWNNLKGNNVKCESKKSEKKLFAYGQKEPMDIAGTFVAEVTCEVSGERCTDEFTVIQGTGKPLLGRKTAEKLNVLRVGPTQKGHVHSITDKNGHILEQYSDIFMGVGKLKDFQLKLHINKDVTPVAQPVRRLPFGLRDKVDEKLDDLLEKDIIEEVPDSPTQWVSPLVVVPKPDGDIRICVDMRKANEAIKRERHPRPTIEEVMYDFNGATIFSNIDLKWGFHQVELEEQSRDITTFVTHRGLYRYKRLMFGITSAPEKYQKIISDVIRGYEGVANIADDLVVFGNDTKEHDNRLHAVLQRLREKGLTLNAKKCQFRLFKLTFFGHVLGGDGIEPSEEKIAAIVNARPPENVSEVRSFVQLAQYSSKFIPNFAQVAEPLRKLLRKGQVFAWGSEQQQSFDKLKELMTAARVLAYFRNDCNTRIVADAGPHGIGAVLLQFQGDMWRAISYASRNLSEVERRYAQTEKEALALVWACERFNIYVYGRQFELETDHKPLECIFRKTSKPSARIERWVLRLQCYDYKVVYRPGKTNIADALSRLNQEKPKDESSETEDAVRFVAREATPIALSTREIELNLNLSAN